MIFLIEVLFVNTNKYFVYIFDTNESIKVPLQKENKFNKDDLKRDSRYKKVYLDLI